MCGIIGHACFKSFHLIYWREEMREAVIVSTARTPIGKAYRGAFNDTSAQELAGHAIEKAVERVNY